jgi:hypothetical protein
MWNDTDTPLAYFISFRTYGTWLHGDKRGSIDRFQNRYRSPYIRPNGKWQKYNEQRLKARPLILVLTSWDRRLSRDHVVNGQGDDLPDFDD